MENVRQIAMSELTFVIRESGELRQIVVMKDEVLGLTDKTKTDKSPTPDGIHATEIADLTKIYNLSLRAASTPEAWKVANVKPILRQGSRKLQCG